MGKAEGRGENWHGHVTAFTVSARRLGLAATLMAWLEDVSEKEEPTSWTCLYVYRTKFQSICRSVLVIYYTEQY
jgi:N-terminal acetyltransferase B complex catalytic subunit